MLCAAVFEHAPPVGKRLVFILLVESLKVEDRERDRERQRETEKETDRQTDRHFLSLLSERITGPGVRSNIKGKAYKKN